MLEYKRCLCLKNTKSFEKGKMYFYLESPYGRFHENDYSKVVCYNPNKVSYYKWELPEDKELIAVIYTNSEFENSFMTMRDLRIKKIDSIKKSLRTF